MKYTVSALLALLMIFSLCACGQPARTSDGFTVVCTTFPLYDFTRNIVGETDGVRVKLLMENGSDLHNFRPAAAQILQIQNADLFIYNGGESDEWVDDLSLDDVKTLAAVDLCRTLVEEDVEGAAHEEEEHEEEEEIDEHVWLSLSRAAEICTGICDALSAANAENADVYAANAAAYKAELSTLDASYREALATTGERVLVVCDRFPFRYLAEDYGLHCFAAFSGCSAESEASFETVLNLANALDKYKLDRVYVLEGSDKKIAETVVGTAAMKDVEILTLNSMQSVTAADVKGGATYLSIAKANLEILKAN